MIKKREFPKRVTVEMTNDCNLSCHMCPRHFMDTPIGYINERLWYGIIDEISVHNVVLIPFWRGESTLHRNFLPMMAYARERVGEIHIATNGVDCEEAFPAIMESDFVSVSCHTGKGFGFVRQIWDRKRELGKDKPFLQATAVEGEKYDTEIEALANVYADRIRIYKQHSREGQFGSVGETKHPRRFCNRLLNEITIDHEGNVSRCCHNWLGDSPINIRSMSIAEAWNSPEYEKIRKTYPDAICDRCDEWSGATTGKTINTITKTEESKS